MSPVVVTNTNDQISRWSGVVVDGRPHMGIGVICRSRMEIIRSRRGECSMSFVRTDIDLRRGSKEMRMRYVSLVVLRWLADIAEMS
jgi:hypothetical protein